MLLVFVCVRDHVHGFCVLFVYVVDCFGCVVLVVDCFVVCVVVCCVLFRVFLWFDWLCLLLWCC